MPNRANRGPFALRTRIITLAFALLIAALGLTACSHYRLGTSGELSFRRLYIAPVANDAGIAQASAIFSSQLREAFLRDGRVALVNTPEEAEATLTISLAHLGRTVATARPDDTGLARKFDVTVQAFCTLRDQRSGTALIDKRSVETTRQLFTTPSPTSRESDQLQAEYNLLPVLARELADRAAHAVLDVW